MQYAQDLFAIQKAKTAALSVTCGYILIVALCVTPVFVSLVNAGPSDAIILLIIMFVIAAVLVKFFAAAIAPKLRQLFFSSAIARIKLALVNYEIQPQLLQEWQSDSFGLFALDLERKSIFIESAEVNFCPTIIAPNSIVSMQIKPEASMDGIKPSASLPAGTKADAEIKELTFLEIQYRENQNSTPTLVIIPFGWDRKKAVQAFAAIENF